MRTKIGEGGVLVLALVLASLALQAPLVCADDLTGSTTLLCAGVQATECFEGGECGIDLPENLNMPAFIEIDLDAKLLSTTAASGENRTTPITALSREDGSIFLQGHEMGKGFTFVIDEQSGQVTVAIAAQGRAVIVFGNCTPLATASGNK
jgi:hypothetical protein